MKVKFLGILLLCLLYGLNGSSQDDPILFRRVSPQGGFTYGAVRTITQDSLGSVWFGAEHGLYRYNSEEFQKYFSNPEDSTSLPGDNIRKILTTKKGKLWVVTSDGACYFNYQTNQFVPVQLAVHPKTTNLSTIQNIAENNRGQLVAVFYNHIGIFQSQTSNQVDILPFKFQNNESLSSVTFDSSDQLWIGTNRGAVYRSTPPYQTMELFCKHRSETVLTLCSDNNTLWIGYDWGGADHVNENGTIIQHYDQKKRGDAYIPHERVRQILKDSQNRIWLATYSGILLVSKNGNQIIKSNRYNNLPANSIYSLYSDSQNGIWIGTWSGGLTYYNPNENRFLHIQQLATDNISEGDVVSSFAEDQNGIIWIGSENDGLGSYNPKTKEFKHYQIPKKIAASPNIKSLAIDHQNRLWLGIFSKGLWLFDQQTKHFKEVKILNEKRVHIYNIWPVENGLWLASFSHGVIFYNFETKKITRYSNNSSDPNSLSSNTARCLIKDSYGGIWVGTNYGLNYLAKGSTKFQRYLASAAKNGISNDEIFSLQEDHAGKIWIGTGGGGVDCFDPNTGQFRNFTKADGLAGFNVYGILEDNQANLWFSTENGISCYNPQSNHFRNFHEDNGLQGNQFNPGAAYKTTTGLFLFGGPNGYNMINPASIGLNSFNPVARIARMYVNNVPLENYEKKQFNFVTTLSSIELPYYENSLSFEFVASNYILPDRNRFRYRLKGYDDQWVDSGVEGLATFTKIPPGNYILEVMASNNDGIWSSQITHLVITITPPFWLTWYAYLFYLMLLVVTAIIIRKALVIRRQLKDELLVERVKNEKEEELHQAKLQLFTNISHEFKTPLTLILSPLDHIMRNRKFDPDTDDHLQMVKRNADRLNRLISQVIDFRKLELGKSSFHPQPTDLVKLGMEVCDFFKVYAKDKHIDFSLTAEIPQLVSQADEEKIDKVLFNFLSNAFKNTPDGGVIKVQIRQLPLLNKLFKTGFCTNTKLDGSGIEIRVDDNGNGIDPQELPLIFNRFYQGEETLQQGTGIGLHLCREYAEMHQGAIYVESELGRGSRFSLILPTDILIENEEPQLEKKWFEPQKGETLEEEPVVSGQTILIVEDHLEMQRHLRYIFQDEYHVLTASNGNQGFDIASEFSPNLIVSDVMMPGKDGFELCAQLKEDIRTSHIPVILLTALSETDKHISGLQTGADAYMTKPFDDLLLKAQVKNLLKSRTKLQESFVNSQEEWEGDTSLMPADKNLVTKAIRIIERHLQDVNFSVEMLAAELNISRSSLHRKIKALTNQSSTEFIRYVRLKKAIQLMKDGNYNIDEIGYAVGFNSHSYFTQSFKKQFGETPSAYMNDLKKSD